MIRVQVSGKVQGVGFRATTQKFARNLQLYGYAKNLNNGDVEIGVETQDQKDVELLINQLISCFTITSISYLSRCNESFSDFKIL